MGIPDEEIKTSKAALFIRKLSARGLRFGNENAKCVNVIVSYWHFDKDLIMEKKDYKNPTPPVSTSADCILEKDHFGAILNDRVLLVPNAFEDFIKRKYIKSAEGFVDYVQFHKHEVARDLKWTDAEVADAAVNLKDVLSKSFPEINNPARRLKLPRGSGFIPNDGRYTARIHVATNHECVLGKNDFGAKIGDDKVLYLPVEFEKFLQKYPHKSAYDFIKYAVFFSRELASLLGFSEKDVTAAVKTLDNMLTESFAEDYNADKNSFKCPPPGGFIDDEDYQRPKGGHRPGGRY